MKMQQVAGDSHLARCTYHRRITQFYPSFTRQQLHELRRFSSSHFSSDDLLIDIFHTGVHCPHSHMHTETPTFGCTTPTDQKPVRGGLEEGALKGSN